VSSDGARRVAWHGLLLAVVGLLMGVVVQSVRNPRMGLSAHVGTLMNGIFLLALAGVWDRLALASGREAAARWLVVVGSWIGCAALFAAGVFGTSHSTPLHGAGYTGTPLEETAVALGLQVGAATLLAGCALALLGLRRRVATAG